MGVVVHFALLERMAAPSLALRGADYILLGCLAAAALVPPRKRCGIRMRCENLISKGYNFLIQVVIFTMLVATQKRI